MLGLQYSDRVKTHWKNHFPKKYQRLKKEGMLDVEAQKVSRQASEQVANLVQKGMKDFEAEEMVLPDLVYPRPDPLLPEE